MSCEKTCNMQHRAKKRAKTMQNHVMQNHVMPKPCHAKTMQKTSCSTCCKKQAVPHVMQKPCKNYATCGAYAGVYTGQVARQGGYAGRGREATQGAAGRLRRARQPAEHPLSAGSMLYVLYVLYLTRQATEHPLSPGSLLYVLYVLYLTRQATEHPLPPGSMLYVLYVLYGPYIAYIVQISRVQSI